jgi:hemerythrin
MAYTWNSDLETGNKQIDSQHRQLIDAINALLDACARGQGRTVIAPMTKFLYDYTSKHFADEEKLQLDSGYPDYENHKLYHEGFKKVVHDISKQLDEQGATIALLGKVNSSIGDWLVKHIKREDVKVAAHVRSRSI